VHSYWVITVVPYLLYAFVNNHSLETCQKIYKVSHLLICNLCLVNGLLQIPVALAMWNQVGSECPLLLCAVNTDTEINASPPAVLLIRTYAFFNRNKFVLAGLLCALGGVIAYQLYVDTSQMIGKRPSELMLKAQLSLYFSSAVFKPSLCVYPPLV
jgi:hypothetical protein